jgi:hypothetical protein
MTHVPSSTDTPRSPESVGIATLAIDESSTFMKVARATANVPSANCQPVNGAGALAFFGGFMLRPLRDLMAGCSQAVADYLICQIFG